MSNKTVANHRRYVIIAAVIGVFIILEWVSVFFFGHVAPGYP